MLRLSPHFTLAELTVSEVAARNGLDNTPDAAAVENLRWLCMAILEPIREAVKTPIVVTSGYRSEKVNHWVGGSKNSDHLRDNAADIRCPAIEQPALFEIMRSMDLPFYQLIDEFGAWVHVSFRPGEPIKREMLRARKKQKAGVDYVAI